MDGPRFMQPHAPARHGTSHVPLVVPGRKKGVALPVERPNARLKAATKILAEVIQRREDRQKKSTEPPQTEERQQWKKGKDTAGAPATATAAPTAAPRARPLSAQERVRREPLRLSKAEFEGAKYNKHKMKVADNWTAGTTDFDQVVTREGREKAQKEYASHTNDLYYFDAQDVGEEEWRRRKARPQYRVKGGLPFGSQPSREQRAFCSRSTTAVEREGIAMRLAQERTKEAAAAASSASPSRAGHYPPVGEEDNGQETRETASATPTPRAAATATAAGAHQRQRSPAGSSLSQQHPVDDDHFQQQDLHRQATAKPMPQFDKGVPSFDRSVHSSVSLLTKAAQDEALLWGGSSSSTSTKTALLLLGRGGAGFEQGWKPFSLGAYSTDKKLEHNVPVPDFTSMAGHDGYTRRRPRSAKVSGSKGGRSLSYAGGEPDEHSEGRPSISPAAAASVASKRPMPGSQVAVEDGKRHVLLDKRVVSVPDFGKTLGKEAQVTGYLAREPVRDIDYGLNPNRGPEDRHVPSIRLDKQLSPRPAARQVAFSSNMQLFPKYTVIESESQSPRIGPGKQRTRPGSAPTMRRPMSAGFSASQVGPATSTNKTVKDGVAAVAGKQSNDRKHVVPLGGPSKDDLIHPRIVRDVHIGPKPVVSQVFDTSVTDA